MKPNIKEEDKIQQIWQVISAIPAGKVATYGQVASLAGLPGYARYVGFVLKNLPEGSSLPWHRVINSQGRLSFAELSAGYTRQSERLQNEGIAFINGRIRLKAYQWQV